MTIFFRRLADYDHRQNDITLADIVEDALYEVQAFDALQRQSVNSWASAYSQRLESQAPDKDARKLRMDGVNPCFLLRNYLTQEAIDRMAEGDCSMLHELHAALQKPYEENQRFARFYKKRPDWARHKAGCSMLSCSS